MKRLMCVLVLMLLVLSAADVVAGGRGSYGGRGGYARGGHYGGSWGAQQPVVWSTQIGGWTVYRVGGGVVPSAPLPPPSTYWLYCRDLDVYYPYVRDCPGGWLQVEPPAGDGGR